MATGSDVVSLRAIRVGFDGNFSEVLRARIDIHGSIRKDFNPLSKITKICAATRGQTRSDNLKRRSMAR